MLSIYQLSTTNCARARIYFLFLANTSILIKRGFQKCISFARKYKMVASILPVHVNSRSIRIN